MWAVNRLIPLEGIADPFKKINGVATTIGHLLPNGIMEGFEYHSNLSYCHLYIHVYFLFNFTILHVLE